MQLNVSRGVLFPVTLGTIILIISIQFFLLQKFFYALVERGVPLNVQIQFIEPRKPLGFVPTAVTSKIKEIEQLQVWLSYDRYDRYNR